MDQIEIYDVSVYNIYIYIDIDIDIDIIYIHMVENTIYLDSGGH